MRGYPWPHCQPSSKMHPSEVVWDGYSLGLAFFVGCVAKLWGLRLLQYALSAEIDLCGNLLPVKGTALKAKAAKDAGLACLITAHSTEVQDLRGRAKDLATVVTYTDVWEVLESMVGRRRLRCSAGE